PIFLSLRTDRSPLYTLSLLTIRPPPTSPLFPYTTLFRSLQIEPDHLPIAAPEFVTGDLHIHRPLVHQSLLRTVGPNRPDALHLRSEEHTSELQSLTNLVCRLLLEKKNNHTQSRMI